MKKSFLLKNYKSIIIILLILVNVVIICFSIYLHTKFNHLTLEDIDTSKLLYDKELIEKEAYIEFYNGKENYVLHDENGNRINNSEKVKEQKEVFYLEGLYVETANIVVENEISIVNLKMKNNLDTNIENRNFRIIFINENGERIIEKIFKVDLLEANSEKNVELSIQKDLANIYNYTIELYQEG